MFFLQVDDETNLELFQPHHANELFWLVDSNRYYLREWLPWVDSITSPADYYRLIPQWQQQFAENNGFHVGIRYRELLVGSISLHEIDWHNGQTSIGYFLAQGIQRKGLMTRSVTAVLHYVFLQLRLNRVEIRCGVNNHKSRAIPERLGFTAEGIVRDGENLYGQFHDLILYSMLQREWRLKNRS